MTTQARWLPVELSFAGSTSSITWIDFRAHDPTEPFFHQTIDHLRATVPPAPEKSTDLFPLFEEVQHMGAIPPAGLVFHVTRCGSTLIANALRTSPRAVVLSEARPTELLLRPGIFRDSQFPQAEWPQLRRRILQSLVTIYGHVVGGRDAKVVIKFHAVNLLQYSVIRSIWPNTPCIVVIRDPIEVIVSNLRKPAPWVGWKDKQPEVAARFFGWTTEDIGRMSIEEYCARGLGNFFMAALAATETGCRVIDYTTLNTQMLAKIGELFGIPLDMRADARLNEVLQVYAKDPAQARRFSSDQTEKQNLAGDEVRRAVGRWARPAYELLTNIRGD